MIISKKRKFIFFHNPKVAGTSFRRSIEEYHDFGRAFWGEEFNPYLNVTVDLAHLRAWEIPCVAPVLFAELEAYRKLIFVRHPTRRFISSCFEHFRKFRPELGFIERDTATQRAMIRELIETRITSFNVLSDVQFVHFSLQKWYVFLGTKRIVDHILPARSDIEDFNSAYDILEVPRRPVGRENRSAPERYDALMTPEIEDFVKRFYTQDFEMLQSFDYLRVLLD